jgi:hypothetical protein
LTCILGFSANWDAVGSIASAIATIAALITIILSIKSGKDNENEKHYAVQAWFHVTSISRMGANAPIQLILLNDAVSTIRIDKVNMSIGYEIIELEYRYLKKDERFNVTGKCFELSIKNNNTYYGKEAYIDIYYTNLYNKKMIAKSPLIKFQEKIDEHTLLDIKAEKFLYIPFKNELI